MRKGVEMVQMFFKNKIACTVRCEVTLGETR